MRNNLNGFSSALDPSPVRVWSLIVTIFGDCVMPRGGEVWLGTITQILSAFDVEAGSVRTAASRLTRDGFLERRRTGRTSHYAMTESAEELSHKAEALIYRTTMPPPPPDWEILLPEGSDAAHRKSLDAAGYRTLAPGVFIRPHRGDARDVEGVRLVASGDDAALAARLYDIGGVAARYRAFTDATERLHTAGAPFDALATRVALVHSFRRIVLRDPHLPLSALPDDWPADEAYAAFAAAYRALQSSSEAWLTEHGQNAAGPLPIPTDGRRFADNM